jgi:hypothetical protein
VIGWLWAILSRIASGVTLHSNDHENAERVIKEPDPKGQGALALAEQYAEKVK